MDETNTKVPLRQKLRIWLKRSSIYLSIVVLVLLFVGVLLIDRIFYTVRPGEQGVRWSRFGGTVLDRVYPEGMRIIPPWDEMYIYSIRVQEIHGTVSVLSSNGLPISIDYSARFFPGPETLPLLHQRFGPGYIDLVMRPEVVAALREVIGNYRPEEIYARDEQGLLNEVFNVLQANMVTNLVVVQDVLIKALRLTPELEAAINQKLVDDQRQLAYEFRLKREEAEKTRKEIEAEGIRNFEAIAGISILRWRGIEATENIAKSPNSKIIIIGTGEGQLPVILNTGPEGNPQ